MAYRRYRRRGYRRRGYKPKVKKGTSTFDKVMSVASTALKVANFVRGIVNAEFKYADLNLVPTNVDFNGITGNFHNIVQGTTSQTRNGDTIKLSSLQIRGTLQSASTATGPVFVRFILVQGIKEQGAAPVLDNILTTVGTAAVINSLREVNPESNYKVLMDKTFRMNIGTDNQNKAIEIYIRPKHHIKYNTGTVNAASGGLYYFFVSNVSANLPSVQFQSRIRFIDN